MRIGGRFLFLFCAAALSALTAPAVASVTTELVSGTPAGNPGFFGPILGDVSRDGTRVFFTTDEALLSEDTDSCPADPENEIPPGPCLDVYERNLVDGTTTLVSTGPTGAHGPFGAGFLFASAGGERVLFNTDEPLVAADTDGETDIYERSGGQTSLLTAPAPGGLDGPVSWLKSSADGKRVFFQTDARFSPADTDSARDIYERSGGVTTLVSTGPADDNRAVNMTFNGASPDGAHVFFTTSAPLVNEDTDACAPGETAPDCPNKLDVYERSQNTTKLLSVGRDGTSPRTPTWVGASADGLRVWFSTITSLVSEDDDQCFIGAGCEDIYERAAGTTTLISSGPQHVPSPQPRYQPAYFGGASEDGNRVYFTTSEALVSGDVDGSDSDAGIGFDIYERFAGATKLVSTGPTDGQRGAGASFMAVSRESSRVFFTSGETLTSDDGDGGGDPFGCFTCSDIYENDGTTRLISSSPTGSTGRFGVLFRAISLDGSRVVYVTDEPLTAADSDTEYDLYQRFDGTATLLSRGPAGGNGPVGVFEQKSSDDARRVAFRTSESLVSEDTDNRTDIYVTSINEPPECAAVDARTPVLLRPNRSFRAVSLVGGSDPDGDHVTIAIHRVTQDEPVKDRRDRTSPDARLLSSSRILLRAERNPAGDGRVYRLAFTATDGFGASCTGEAKVAVPRHRGTPAVDSAPPSYDSFAR